MDVDIKKVDLKKGDLISLRANRSYVLTNEDNMFDGAVGIVIQSTVIHRNVDIGVKVLIKGQIRIVLNPGGWIITRLTDGSRRDT